MANVESRVKAVIGRVLNIKPDEMKDEDRFVEDLGAESIQSIELVAEFESEFDIEMDEDDAMAVKSVGSAVKYLHKIVGE